jgi:hypothetical protein
MARLPTQPNTTLRYLYNPSKEDFIITWDGEPHTLHSEELEPFPTYLADHIAKHLAHKLVMERGVKTNYDDDIKLMLKEIETDL